MSKLGINETKDALLLGVALVAFYKSTMSDGKFDTFDYLKLPALIGPVGAAVSGGAAIPLEMADLQEGEYDELLAVVSPVIKDLTPDEYEIFIFTALGAVKSVLQLFGIAKV